MALGPRSKAVGDGGVRDRDFSGQVDGPASEPAIGRTTLGVHGVTPVSPEYLAGFLDGEGSITFAWHWNGNPKSRGRTPRLIIGLYNTFKPVLEDIKAQWGGGDVLKSPPNKLGKRTCWRLRLSQGQVAKILPEVMPHLRIKRMQAEIAMEFLAFEAARGATSRRMISPEVRAIHRDFAERMWTANGSDLRNKEFPAGPRRERLVS